MFTLMDEMLASPTEPMPADDAASRVAAALHHLERLATEPAPNVMEWRVCAMVGNFMEVLLELGIAQDPDGLLVDAFAALRAAAERNLRAGKTIRLTGPGLVAIRGLIRDFAEILEQAPHRTIIRAFRETDKRVRSLDRGGRRPSDYVAQVGLARS
jgi:hypothetical protein